MLEMVLTRLAQFVAVTVPSALTVLNPVCPQPLSPDPVLQMSLTLAPDVVLAKPLKSVACISPPDEYAIIYFPV